MLFTYLGHGFDHILVLILTEELGFASFSYTKLRIRAINIYRQGLLIFKVLSSEIIFKTFSGSNNFQQLLDELLIYSLNMTNYLIVRNFAE